jgi:hypothetical protein
VQREAIDWLPRKSRRTGVSIAGVGRWTDGSIAPVLVSEISYDGCRLWSDHCLERGETLTLSLPGRGTIEAQVRWVVSGCAGAKFLTGSSSVDDRRARIGV